MIEHIHSYPPFISLILLREWAFLCELCEKHLVKRFKREAVSWTGKMWGSCVNKNIVCLYESLDITIYSNSKYECEQWWDHLKRMERFRILTNICIYRFLFLFIDSPLTLVNDCQNGGEVVQNLSEADKLPKESWRNTGKKILLLF